MSIRYGQGQPIPPKKENTSHVSAVLPPVDYRSIAALREANQVKGRKELRQLAKEGYTVLPIDGTMFNAQHFRINGMLEIWPSRNRFRFFASAKQRYSHGAIEEPQSILEFVHERLPLTPKIAEELRMDRELGV